MSIVIAQKSFDVVRGDAAAELLTNQCVHAIHTREGILRAFGVILFGRVFAADIMVRVGNETGSLIMNQLRSVCGSFDVQDLAPTAA